MWPKIKAYLISFDIVGPKQEFLHQGQERYNTFFGLFTTIFLFFLTASTLDSKITEFYYYVDPSVNIVDYYSDIEEFTSNSSNFNIFFQFMYFDFDKFVFQQITKEELLNLTTITQNDISNKTNSYNSSIFIPMDKGVGDVVEPLLALANVTRNRYELLNITNPINNETKRFQGISFCKDNPVELLNSYMDSYNNHLDYNRSSKLSEEEIEFFKNNSYCVSDYMNYYMDQFISSGTYILKAGFRLPMTTIKMLKKNPKFNYIVLRIYYQQSFINTSPEYYSNYQYFKNVWRFYDIFINDEVMQIHNFKIQKTLIDADKTRFIFNIEENSTTYNVDYSGQEANLQPNRRYDDFAITATFELNNYERYIRIKYTSLDDILGLFFATFDVFSLIAVKGLSYFIGPFYTSSLINNIFNFHENKYSQEDVENYLNEVDVPKNWSKRSSNLELKKVTSNELIEINSPTKNEKDKERSTDNIMNYKIDLKDSPPIPESKKTTSSILYNAYFKSDTVEKNNLSKSFDSNKNLENIEVGNDNVINIAEIEQISINNDRDDKDDDKRNKSYKDLRISNNKIFTFPNKLNNKINNNVNEKVNEKVNETAPDKEDYNINSDNVSNKLKINTDSSKALNKANKTIKTNKTIPKSHTYNTNSTLIGKNLILEDLKEKLKFRSNLKVTPKEIYIIDYCHCCTKLTQKENLINEVRDYIDKCFEVSRIVAYRREVDFLKMLLLNDDQRRLYILPSLNTNFENNINLEVDYDHDEAHELHFDIDLVNHVADIDLNNLTSKKLLRSMIESII